MISLDNEYKLANRIKTVCSHDIEYPFPYKECSKLLENEDIELADGFIPEVDYYASTLVGYTSSALIFQKWSSQRVDDSFNFTTQSFIETHPQYKLLLSKVNPTEFPLLWKRFTTYEHLRVMLHQLTTMLKSKQA